MSPLPNPEAAGLDPFPTAYVNGVLVALLVVACLVLA